MHAEHCRATLVTQTDRQTDRERERERLVIGYRLHTNDQSSVLALFTQTLARDRDKRQITTRNNKNNNVIWQWRRWDWGIFRGHLQVHQQIRWMYIRENNNISLDAYRATCEDNKYSIVYYYTGIKLD